MGNSNSSKNLRFETSKNTHQSANNGYRHSAFSSRGVNGYNSTDRKSHSELDRIRRENSLNQLRSDLGEWKDADKSHSFTAAEVEAICDASNEINQPTQERISTENTSIASKEDNSVSSVKGASTDSGFNTLQTTTKTRTSVMDEIGPRHKNLPQRSTSLKLEARPWPTQRKPIVKRQQSFHTVANERPHSTKSKWLPSTSRFKKIFLLDEPNPIGPRPSGKDHRIYALEEEKQYHKMPDGQIVATSPISTLRTNEWVARHSVNNSS